MDLKNSVMETLLGIPKKNRVFEQSVSQFLSNDEYKERLLYLDLAGAYLLIAIVHRSTAILPSSR